MEVVFLHTEQTITLHLAKLIGERTAVDVEIVGKLLSVKWNDKIAAALPDCLIRKV